MLGVQKIPLEEAKRLFDRKEADFVDARSEASWGESDAMIPGSIRVPPDAVDEHLDRVPRDRTIVTYCT
jgi:rhodanese-related sulfurtransferase